MLKIITKVTLIIVFLITEFSFTDSLKNKEGAYRFKPEYLNSGFTIENSPIRLVESILSLYFKKPLCIEESDILNSKRYSIEIRKDTEPEKVIKKLLKGNKIYTYIITKDYINILPRKEFRPDTYLLDQKINKFTIKKKIISVALNELYKQISEEHKSLITSEYTDTDGKKSIVTYVHNVSSFENKDNSYLNIDMNNCTIREILNEMVTQNNRYYWFFDGKIIRINVINY